MLSVFTSVTLTFSPPLNCPNFFHTHNMHVTFSRLFQSSIRTGIQFGDTAFYGHPGVGFWTQQEGRVVLTLHTAERTGGTDPAHSRKDR